MTRQALESVGKTGQTVEKDRFVAIGERTGTKTAFPARCDIVCVVRVSAVQCGACRYVCGRFPSLPE